MIDKTIISTSHYEKKKEEKTVTEKHFCKLNCTMRKWKEIRNDCKMSKKVAI